VQVIHVEDDGAIDLIAAYEPYVHAFLLDSGRPNAPMVELGGTGRVHDWQISKRFVLNTTRPVFLAGGLHADNVAKAIDSVKPYGVDLCSGVRTNGALDVKKLVAFMRALGVTS
jgi:phosphoribosylanthranilate isomerase